VCHIGLAAPVVHIWYLRGTRSWLAYLLMGTLPREELKAKQLEKVIYFAANIVTWVDEEKRDANLPNLEQEVALERETIEKERELELARRQEELEAELVEPEGQGAKDTESKGRRRAAGRDLAAIRERYDRERDVLGRAFGEFKSLFARQSIGGGRLWRELASRFGDYSAGGMGAEAITRLIARIDLDEEEIKLR